MSQKGLLVLMDGSYHRWFGKHESCLIVAMDDATSDILHAEFCDSETTVDCLRVLRHVVRLCEGMSLPPPESKTRGTMSWYGIL